MIEAYKKFLRNYGNFEGRSCRSDFWYVVLADILIVLALLTLSIIPIVNILSLLALAVYSLLIIVPGIALVIRRLHDVGKGGQYLLITFVPVIGNLVLLVWLAKDGYPGTNRYGVNPKDYEA